MKVIDRGLLNRGERGSKRAISMFPAVTALADGTLLASYKVGSAKECDDGTIELRRSRDGGRCWSDPITPFDTNYQGKRGSLLSAYITEVSESHLLAAAIWADHEAFPGKPLFNYETEGVLPLTTLLSDSFDNGKTWSPWRNLPMPDDVPSPGLTCPILCLPSGRLAASLEIGKEYEDESPWNQRVVYSYSDDSGKTWGTPVTVCQDPTGRIFNWDQRTAITQDGRLISVTWTYNRETGRYLNVHRRLSSDEGATWTPAEDLGFADQASQPAVLPDGRVVVAWVDRYETRSIRVRLAASIDAPFLPESEIILYEMDGAVSSSAEGGRSVGDILGEMSTWSFGLPFATSLHDGDIMVVFYEGSPESMQVRWVRLSV